MSGLWTPPNGSPRINYASGLSEDIELVVVPRWSTPASLVNLVNGQVGTVDDGAPAEGDGGKYGESIRFNSDGVSFDYVSSEVDHTTPYTVSVLIKLATYDDAFRGIVALNTASGSHGRLVSYFRNGSSYGCVFASKNSGSVYEARALPTDFTAGTWYHVVFTRGTSSAAAPKVYKDGYDVTTTENFSYGHGSKDEIVIGQPWSTFGNFFMDAHLAQVSVWHREFTADEVLSLYSDPWGHLRFRTIVSIFGAGGGGGTPVAGTQVVGQEALAAVAGTQAVGHEAEGAVAGTQGVGHEALLGVASTQGVGHESIAAASSTQVVGHEAVNKTVSTQTIGHEAQGLEPVAGTQVVDHEARADAVGTQVVGHESVEPVASTQVVGHEALLGVSNTEEVGHETLLAVAGTQVVGHEAEGVPVTPVAGTQVIPHEAIANVAGTQVVGHEADGVTFRAFYSQMNILLDAS